MVNFFYDVTDLEELHYIPSHWVLCWLLIITSTAAIQEKDANSLSIMVIINLKVVKCITMRIGVLLKPGDGTGAGAGDRR